MRDKRNNPHAVLRSFKNKYELISSSDVLQNSTHIWRTIADGECGFVVSYFNKIIGKIVPIDDSSVSDIKHILCVVDSMILNKETKIQTLKSYRASLSFWKIQSKMNIDFEMDNLETEIAVLETLKTKLIGK